MTGAEIGIGVAVAAGAYVLLKSRSGEGKPGASGSPTGIDPRTKLPLPGAPVVDGAGQVPRTPPEQSPEPPPANVTDFGEQRLPYNPYGTGDGAGTAPVDDDPLHAGDAPSYAGDEGAAGIQPLSLSLNTPIVNPTNTTPIAVSYAVKDLVSNGYTLTF